MDKNNRTGGESMYFLFVDKEENAMDKNKQNTVKTAAIGFAAGAIAGAAAAYLSDEENREEVMKKAKELKEKGQEKVNQLQNIGQQKMHALRKSGINRLEDTQKTLHKTEEKLDEIKAILEE